MRILLGSGGPTDNYRSQEVEIAGRRNIQVVAAAC